MLTRRRLVSAGCGAPACLGSTCCGPPRRKVLVVLVRERLVRQQSVCSSKFDDDDEFDGIELRTAGRTKLTGQRMRGQLFATCKAQLLPNREQLGPSRAQFGRASLRAAAAAAAPKVAAEAHKLGCSCQCSPQRTVNSAAAADQLRLNASQFATLTEWAAPTSAHSNRFAPTTVDCRRSQ